MLSKPEKGHTERSLSTEGIAPMFQEVGTVNPLHCWKYSFLVSIHNSCIPFPQVGTRLQSLFRRSLHLNRAENLMPAMDNCHMPDPEHHSDPATLYKGVSLPNEFQILQFYTQPLPLLWQKTQCHFPGRILFPSHAMPFNCEVPQRDFTWLQSTYENSCSVSGLDTSKASTAD